MIYSRVGSAYLGARLVAQAFPPGRSSGYATAPTCTTTGCEEVPFDLGCPDVSAAQDGDDLEPPPLRHTRRAR